MKRTIMMTAIALMTGVLAGYWFCHARVGSGYGKDERVTGQGRKRKAEKSP